MRSAQATIRKHEGHFLRIGYGIQCQFIRIMHRHAPPPPPALRRTDPLRSEHGAADPRRLGLDPWDVFHQGVSEKTGLSFGTIVIITGAAVLLAWIPLRQKPGIGTISNVFVIGIAVDATLALIPDAHDCSASS